MHQQEKMYEQAKIARLRIKVVLPAAVAAVTFRNCALEAGRCDDVDFQAVVRIRTLKSWISL